MSRLKKMLSFFNEPQSEYDRELDRAMALLEEISLLETILRNKNRQALVDRLKKELEENG